MKFLLIQFRTDQSMQHEQRCVKVHAELQDEHLDVLNPMTNPTAVAHTRTEGYDAVIVGGSGEFNLSARTPELQAALDVVKPLIDQALAAEQPFLGMCFGHQILAEHLGGRVELMDEGAKAGTYEVTVNEQGRVDNLYTKLPDHFTAQHGHKEAVAEPPVGATVLSYNSHDPHASFRYGSRAYGIQYHPELSQDDIVYRLLLYPSYTGGKSEAELRQEFLPTPHAPKLLRNFRRIVESYRQERGWTARPKTA